jgi:hypothetical protein
VRFTPSEKSCANIYCLQHCSACKCHERRPICLQKLVVTDPQPPTMQVDAGEWVVVIYGDKWYLGEVVGIAGCLLDIKYMAERGENR